MAGLTQHQKDMIKDIADVITIAILAERKRCADVARHLNGWGSDCGRGGHAEHIAKMIEAA